MANIIEKVIQSPTAPKDKNVLWDNGEELKINRRGVWVSVINSKILDRLEALEQKTTNTFEE